MKWHDITVGIMGGCLLAQKEIGLNNLFHRRLSARLKTEAGCKARFRFGTYTGIEDAVQKYLAMTGKGDLDVLLFHVRPQSFLAMTKPVVKYADARGRTRFSLHPALFNRQADWDAALDGCAESATPVPDKPAPLPAFNPINLLLGKLLRLDKWACGYLSEFLLHLNEVCKRHGTRLFIVGPSALPASLPGHLNCMHLNRRIRELAHVHAIPCVGWFTDRDSSGNYLFMDDGLHLNPDGHNFLADRILSSFLVNLPLESIVPVKHPAAA